VAIHSYARVIVLQRKRDIFPKLLLEGRVQRILELLSNYVSNLFISVQSQYTDVTDDIRVKRGMNTFSRFETVSCWSTVLHSLHRGRLASGTYLEALQGSVKSII